MCHYPARPLQLGPRAQNCCPRQHAKAKRLETGSWRRESFRYLLRLFTTTSTTAKSCSCPNTFFPHCFFLSSRSLPVRVKCLQKHTGCVGIPELELHWSLENESLESACLHQSNQGSPLTAVFLSEKSKIHGHYNVQSYINDRRQYDVSQLVFKNDLLTLVRSSK